MKKNRTLHLSLLVILLAAAGVATSAWAYVRLGTLLETTLATDPEPGLDVLEKVVTPLVDKDEAKSDFLRKHLMSDRANYRAWVTTVRGWRGSMGAIGGVFAGILLVAMAAGVSVWRSNKALQPTGLASGSAGG